MTKFEVFDEEESNIHLVKLKGKVVRDGKCPLKKIILCENCEDYDGWGISIHEHNADIYCKNSRIIDGSKLTLFPVINKKKKEKKWFINLIGRKKNDRN